MTGETAQSITIDTTDSLAKIICSKSTLIARNIGFTRNTILENVSIDNEQIIINANPIETTHVHFLASTPVGGNNFTFLNFKDDKYFHMISDVTKYANTSDENLDNTSLIAVWLNGDSIEDDSCAQTHFDRLKSLKILPSDSELLDWEKRTYSMFNLSKNTIQSLVTISPSTFQFLETGDLTLAIQDYADEWTSYQ